MQSTPWARRAAPDEAAPDEAAPDEPADDESQEPEPVDGIRWWPDEHGSLVYGEALADALAERFACVDELALEPLLESAFDVFTNDSERGRGALALLCDHATGPGDLA